MPDGWSMYPAEIGEWMGNLVCVCVFEREIMCMQAGMCVSQIDQEGDG
jgi:hypothetical protein